MKLSIKHLASFIDKNIIPNRHIIYFNPDNWGKGMYRPAHEFINFKINLYKNYHKINIIDKYFK